MRELLAATPPPMARMKKSSGPINPSPRETRLPSSNVDEAAALGKRSALLGVGGGHGGETDGVRAGIGLAGAAGTEA